MFSLNRLHISRDKGRIWIISLRLGRWYWLVFNRATGVFLTHRRAFTSWEYRLVRLGGCYMNGRRFIRYS